MDSKSQRMLFSPFDALGLDPDQCPYESRDIQQAYRRSALAVHPDKRRQNGVAYDRWPQIYHLEQAKEFLMDCESQLVARRCFNKFPRTFYPNKPPFFAVVRPLPVDFEQCDICNVVVLRRDLNGHLKEHGQAICDVCGSRLELESLENHCIQVHGFRPCQLCKKILNPQRDGDHLSKYHNCPFCLESQVDAITGHMEIKHHLHWCDDCHSDDPVSHIIRTHPHSVCHACDEIIFHCGLLGHLRSSHGLSFCLECDTWGSETPIEELWSHITSSLYHAWDQCVFCKTIYLEQGLLQNHLAGTHEIRTCSFCPSETSFDMMHLFDKHNMSRCPDCGTHLPEERIKPHLRFKHNWVVCTICGVSEPDEDALEDHEDNHPACDICRQQQTKLEDLRKHLEHEHGVVFCPFCSSRTTALLEHVQSEHSLSTESTDPSISEMLAQDVLSTLKTKLERLENLHPRSRDLLDRAIICITQAIELESQLPLGPSSIDGELREQFTSHGASEKSTQVSNSRQHDLNSPDVLLQSRESGKATETELLGSVAYNKGQPKPLANSNLHSNGQNLLKSAAESLLKEITSKETLRKLVEVASSRGQLARLQAGLGDLAPEGDDVYRSVSAISTFIDKCEHGAGCIRIFKLYGLLKITEILERRRTETARQRVDSADYDRILQYKGLENNPRTRAELRQQVKLGRQLQRICGPNTGIICLLAVGVSNIRSIANVEASDIVWFHQSLERHYAICEFGRKCLSSLLAGVELDPRDIHELNTLAQ